MTTNSTAYPAKIRPEIVLDLANMWLVRDASGPLRSKDIKIPPGCNGILSAVGPRTTLENFSMSLIHIPWDSTKNKIGDVYIEDGEIFRLGKVRKNMLFDNGIMIGEYAGITPTPTQTIKVIDFVVDKIVVSTPGIYYLEVECGPDKCDTPLVIEFSLECCCQNHQ